ncbi:hypothetical protein [Pseudomonas sp.]|uniref:hypothetical protein n=1 Tax=Pseudomonas sp. TaxID=306 RepID=UPI003D6EF865
MQSAALLIERLIHAIRSLKQHQAVKFLAPPQHEIKLSRCSDKEVLSAAMILIKISALAEKEAPPGAKYPRDYRVKEKAVA